MDLGTIVFILVGLIILSILWFFVKKAIWIFIIIFIGIGVFSDWGSSINFLNNTVNKVSSVIEKFNLSDFVVVEEGNTYIKFNNDKISTNEIKLLEVNESNIKLLLKGNSFTLKSGEPLFNIIKILHDNKILKQTE